MSDFIYENINRTTKLYVIKTSMGVAEYAEFSFNEEGCKAMKAYYKLLKDSGSSPAAYIRTIKSSDMEIMVLDLND